jgi:hypothetical protein
MRHDGNTNKHWWCHVSLKNCSRRSRVFKTIGKRARKKVRKEMRGEVRAQGRRDAI